MDEELKKSEMYDVDGNVVEIGPTFQTRGESDEYEDDGYVKVDTVEEFERVVKAMGWESAEQFLNDTGVGAQELLGKFWTVIHDTVTMLPK